ncbi:hypothetical protein [Caballeronia cordobensis]|nr:hypothetical protein [Caballeronia cordobensis]
MEETIDMHITALSKRKTICGFTLALLSTAVPAAADRLSRAQV